MTNEQMNIAIAEACGLIPSELIMFGDLPDYCQDLNAMHEAEKKLNGTAMRVYEAILTPNDGFAIHTTASQRAEALLRTIGKWEE